MNRRLLATAALAALFLTGCSAPVPAGPTAVTDAASTDAETNEEGRTDQTDGNTLARITSCDQVATVIAPYIQELVPSADNSVDEWGISCSWNMADDETDFSNNRSVDVSITPEPGEKPDLAQLAEVSELIEPLEDDWVSARGGIAYTMGMEIAVASVIVTTVWLPDATATVAGGEWGDHPSLDGPAAVDVVSALLG